MESPTSVEITKSREYIMRKYLLLLATLVATVTYAVGFNPPGGVWPDTDGGHLAGDPVNRDTHHLRYVVFFYCNATAFASSLIVVVLVLLLAVLHERMNKVVSLRSLRAVMVLDLLSLMGAYTAGTLRDALTVIYSSLLVAAVTTYLVVQMVLASLPDTNNDGENDQKLKEQETPRKVDSPELKEQELASLPDTNNDGENDRELKEQETPRKVDGRELKEQELLASLPDTNKEQERRRKVLMLLATFATSITYVAGLNTPGGFWDSNQDGHHAGDAVLKERHPCRLAVFFICNTTAFSASLLIIVLFLDSKLRGHTWLWNYRLYGCIILALIGLVGAYAAGSSREIDTTIYVGALVCAVLACILFQVAIIRCFKEDKGDTCTNCCRSVAKKSNDLKEVISQLEEARSLVLLLATLAATVTFQAGLDPPGGLYLDEGDGHKAGDPILLTRNPRRYKVFFFCNSTAFAASLVAIVLVQNKLILKWRHSLVAAMILDLFGLIGAYAAGSCREVSTSIYVMALAGAVLVYVVIHTVFFTLDQDASAMSHGEDKLLEKRRRRLLLFAILGATITYQAGLTPPSGFWLEDDQHGHHAGDPILFSNYPRRYKAFFYCNSVSFMSSIALITLLVNPNLYMPAIRGYALSVCTVAGMFGLMGVYAAGSSQHMRTSIYIFVLVAVVLAFVISLLLVSYNNGKKNGTGKTADQSLEQGQASNTGDQSFEQGDKSLEQGGEDTARERYTKRKYLMLLGILAASVTYQAGLDPPGGVWQGNSHRHAAGDPIMLDKRRLRYHVFFYSNSTSFVASIVVIFLLLPEKLQEDQRLLKAMNTTIVLDMLDKRRLRYHVFFYSNSTSFVASIVVIFLLLPEKLQEDQRLLKAMNTTIVLDMLALLGAYAAGSSRECDTFWYVIALIITVLGYVAILLVTSLFNKEDKPQESPNPTQS